MSKVTKATAATPLPRWATAIAHRRMDDLRVSQERIVADSADALTQTDVSRIERAAAANQLNDRYEIETEETDTDEHPNPYL